MTVDLERSFSSGSLVVVKEGRDLTTWEPSNCNPPCLFVDDASGHSVDVEREHGAFVPDLTTGERKKLSKGRWLGISKAGHNPVRVGEVTYNVFTHQPCTSVIWPREAHQPLIDRGLIVRKETSTITSTVCSTLIEAQTGLTLCHFRTLCHSLAFL
ncbi:hypothetical protein Pelo_18614 [Pelomyxa schiedti]|nr:hypothetical protein Pelo_18614 [Pelomyxa schiedti]